MKNRKGFKISDNTPTSLPPIQRGKITPLNSATKGQSKSGSATESLFNILFGFWIAVLAQIIIFPWFDIDVNMQQNIFISMLFTVVSFVRSYALRRVFNYLQVKGQQHGK